MNRTTTTEARLAEPARQDPPHKDPHDRLTPEQKAQFEAYMAAPKELPESCVDPETGRLLPVAPGEMQRRLEELMARLAEIDATMVEDPPDTWERFERDIDQERREMGMRTLFSNE